MRLTVFSDIHGNLMAMDAMLTDLRSIGEVDMLWFLGDLSAFGARPVECIRTLQEMAAYYGEARFKVISGNADRYLVTGERPRRPPAAGKAAFEKLLSLREPMDAALNWGFSKLSWADYQYLADLPNYEITLHVEGYGTVIGYHAVPGDDETIINAETPDNQVLDSLLSCTGRLAIGAHIHKQMDRQVEGWRVVNIGSVGMSFDQPGMAQWGLFTIENGDVAVDLRSVEYDLQAAMADLHSVGYPLPDSAKQQPRKR